MLKLLLLLILPQIVLANTWEDLWLNKNQQGANLLKENKNDEAAKTFTDKNWRGIAYYRDGKYQEAYNEFKQDNSAQGLYNQGNALAHMQKYQEAIDAYNKSLELQKNSPDATYNKELVEKLLKQQQNNSNQKQSDENKAQQNPDKQQSQNKQNSSNQNDEQKNKNEQQQDSKQQSNTQDKQQNSQNKQNSAQEPNPENKQNDQQQNSQNQAQDNSKQQSDIKNNQSKQNSQKQQKPEQEQPTNTNNKIQDQTKQPQQNSENNTQTPIKKDSDNAANENTTSTNSMRPQTPVDIEVKSALSQIPDDPGGLLRNKFLRDYQTQKQDSNNE